MPSERHSGEDHASVKTAVRRFDERQGAGLTSEKHWRQCIRISSETVGLHTRISGSGTGAGWIGGVGGIPLRAVRARVCQCSRRQKVYRGRGRFPSNCTKSQSRPQPAFAYTCRVNRDTTRAVYKAVGERCVVSSILRWEVQVLVTSYASQKGEGRRHVTIKSRLPDRGIGDPR